MTPVHINFPDEHGTLCVETHSDVWHETIHSLAFVVVLSRPLSRIVRLLQFFLLQGRILSKMRIR